MNKYLPTLFALVLGISLAFMVYYMDNLSKLGNTTSVETSSE